MSGQRTQVTAIGAGPPPWAESAAKARVLTELLPWLRAHSGQVQVLRWPAQTTVDGHAEVAALHRVGVPLVLVPDQPDGAGPLVTELNGGHGLTAIGLCGADDRQLVGCPEDCRLPAPHGRDGVHEYRPRLARLLLGAGMIPVVDPTVLDADGRLRAAAADAVAAAVATALVPAQVVQVDPARRYPLLERVFREAGARAGGQAAD